MKERRVEIKCPDAECKYTINEFEIEIISGKDKRVEYNNYTLDQFVDNHGADVYIIIFKHIKMSWCPTPDCKYAFVLGDEEELKDFECLLCKKRYLYYLLFLKDIV
jgi:ariadne-1